MTNSTTDKDGEQIMRATSMKLRAMLPTCQVCGESTEGHSFSQVASTVIGEGRQPVLTQFFSVVKHHRWSELGNFREWRGDSDNLVAYVIKGDHSNGIVVVIKDVFELYAQNEVVILEVLSATEMERIASYLSVEWHTIQGC